MYWRRGSKLQRTVLAILFYVTVYLLISFTVIPNAAITFAEEDFSIGKKYAFIFLSGPKVFKNTNVPFETKKCGKCFLTNNRGFMPLKEYDAVLVSSDGVFDDPAVGQEKKYVVQTRNCIESNLWDCEPVVMSHTKQYYDLCSLCRHLHLKRHG